MSTVTERWPLTLVHRGERVGSSRPDYVWWQELPADEDADSLRGVGYEVVEVVPASALEQADNALWDIAYGPLEAENLRRYAREALASLRGKP